MKDKKAVVLLVLISFSGCLLRAQSRIADEINKPPSQYGIRWVGQFPEDPSERKMTLRDYISGLVFGKKPPEVIKPFNVIAKDIQHYWILDQGLGEVIEVENGEGQPLKAIPKHGIQFPSLVGICRIPGGDLIFTDSKLGKLFRVNSQTCSPFAENQSLDQPTGIAYSDLSGEIWVVETASHRITVLNSEGDVVKRIGERGAGEGSFNFPTFIWIDAAGRVYVVDSMNFRIQILSKEGKYIGAFGENGDATGSMARPKGVATDSHGNIYVSDALFHAVQVFDREGNFLSSFGVQGQQAGAFWMPAGIYVDAADYIYVADSYNSRVQVFQLVTN